VALGRACTLASKAVEETSQNISDLRDRLVAQLQHGIGDGLSVNGAAAARLPNTASVNFPDVSAHDMLAYVPELCASTGAACHSGATSISPTLAAMSLTPEVAKGTIRLSLGWYTSQEDIDLAASRLLFAWDACKS
jgi:cysteine desulfurase